MIVRPGSKCLEVCTTEPPLSFRQQEKINVQANSIDSRYALEQQLPPDSGVLRNLEQTLQAVLQQFGYQEIRLPVLEQTELFYRSLGEVTDIVEKEMYTFEDRNGDSLTLRPEGTASCVRAGLQQGLLYGQAARPGTRPVFSSARSSQKGPYRSFTRLGLRRSDSPGRILMRN